uniref:G-protein coupled receptors family 1 profile domain-containing protein n=1 Tax=Erpetoichthys calabaricus TaxID=27687 RepID=A0A8C4RGZ8_ERPCA
MDIYKVAPSFCPSLRNATCGKIYSSVVLNVALYVIFAIAVFLAVFGNLLLIVSICHFKQLHSVTNLLIASMALSDFMIGLFTMPIGAIKTVEKCWYSDSMLCLFEIIISAILTSVSEVHLLFLAVDRYCAICFPLLYSIKVTLKVGWIFVIISWVSSIVYCFLLIHFSLVYKNNCTGYCGILYVFITIFIDYVLSFILPFSVMIGLYTKILFVAKLHTNKINFGEQNDLSSKQKADKLSFKRQYKAMKTVGIVILVFLACWTPYYLFHFAASFVVFSRGILYVVQWTALFNSSFNPLIYGFFYPWFRKAFKIFMTCKLFEKDSSLINLYSKC